MKFRASHIPEATLLYDGVVFAVVRSEPGREFADVEVLNQDLYNRYENEMSEIRKKYNIGG